MVEASQNSNVKLRVVADVMTAAVTGPEPMPPDLQNHVQTAVERWRSREHEPGVGGQSSAAGRGRAMTPGEVEGSFPADGVRCHPASARSACLRSWTP